MPYSTRDDLELAFGHTNILLWADLNNTALASEITARINWAIANADDELNSKLANSRYQFPLSDDSDIPPILARMSAYFAGVLLYESRGVTDVGEDGKAQHALMWHRKRVDEFIRDIHARRLVLIGVTLKDGAVDPVSETPSMVCFPDPAYRRPVPTLADDMIGITRRCSS